MGFVGAWIETPRKWLRLVRVPLRRGRWLMRRRPKKTEKEVSDIYIQVYVGLHGKNISRCGRGARLQRVEEMEASY